MLNQSVDRQAEHVQRFYTRYMTSMQIAEFVGVTKVSVYNARRSGKLPNSILLDTVCLWERDEIMPYIEAWRHEVMTRKAFKELTARPADAGAWDNALIKA